MIMKASAGAPTDVDVIAERAGTVLAETPSVVFGYLFGSLAGGTAGPLSDIDVAVYLREGTDPGEEKLDLTARLVDALATDRVDVVVLNTAPLPLQARVLRCNHILLDRAPHLRHAFESLVLREYFDFSRFEEAILRRRFSIG
jgi:predicted nucleotidyltransferase